MLSALLTLCIFFTGGNPGLLNKITKGKYPPKASYLFALKWYLLHFLLRRLTARVHRQKDEFLVGADTVTESGKGARTRRKPLGGSHDLKNANFE